MIPVNELRRGNLTKRKYGFTKVDGSHGNCDEFYRITIETFATEIYNNEGRSILKELHPIPLTPEILEMCGFKFITDWSIKENDGVCYRKDLGWLRLETGMMSSRWVTLVDKQGISTGVNIEYLHQLQNLYLDLTGEELEINL